MAISHPDVWCLRFDTYGAIASREGAFLWVCTTVGGADRHEQRASAEQCTLRGMSEECKGPFAVQEGPQRAEYHSATGGDQEGARQPW
jgi:hypothetical protein